MIRKPTVLIWVAASACAYVRLVRPRHIRWGATDDEVARAMPLDDHVPNPTIVSTRGVTIDAPPEAIWPWVKRRAERLVAART